MPTLPTERAAHDRGPLVALLAMVAAYAAGYGWMAWERFATFHSMFDMSYYMRLVWGLAHGRPDLPLVGARHFLGLHLEPILFPLAWLHGQGAPLAPLLLGVQTLAAALVAVPAFRLAARHLGSPCFGLVGAGLALLYPTVTVATLHDFHPVTLALPLLLATVDALDEDRLLRAAAFGIAALACREDVALQLACLALAQAVLRSGRARMLACAASGLLVAYFAIYVFIVQPPLVPPTGSWNLHFAPIAGVDIRSGADLLRAFALHPAAFLSHLTTWDRLVYALLLLAPLGFLGLLAPRFLAGALPVFVLNLLSDFPRVRTVEAHYATTIAPFVIGASLVGAGKLREILAGRGRLALPAALLALVTASHVLWGGSPLAVLSPKWRDTGLAEPANVAAIREAIRAVPKDASVSAHPNILAHLSERPRPIWLPDHTDGLPVDRVITLTPEPGR
ncbi:MAG: DUF2079 domain-containing protein [Deltaproteobacteria bacterium]|nr:DUF2079 domain-containing protein [Deltaproteobacteria bacterium]